MSSNRVSEISVGAGERVGGMVNVISLTSGLLQGQELVGMAGLWVQRLVSTISWWRWGGFQKVTESDLVRRFWVEGSEKRIWKPSLTLRVPCANSVLLLEIAVANRLMNANFKNSTVYLFL